MEFDFVELPNGIRCILKKVNSPVVYCGMTIGVGTRDEKETEHGMAHLIEHLLFKGTKRRKTYHINSLLDNVGGELNAYTTKEETVIHATTLRHDFVKAVDLIADVVFNSIFSDCQIEKERGVIIDEINSYKDSPSELIFDDFEDMIFAGCSLGRNILGTPRYLKKFTGNDLIDFTSRLYTTDNMVFSMVGNVSKKRFTDVCMSLLGHFPAVSKSTQREAVPQYKKQNNIIVRKGYQANCIIGTRAYSHSDKRRVTLALLSNILGGSSANSRFNNVLREKYGLTYSVESSYMSYYDTGLTSIYFGCEKENIDRCMCLINKELCSVKNNAFTPLQLTRYKKQLLGQLAISSESSESLMLNGAKSFLIYNMVDSLEDIANKINTITPGEILDVANDIFDIDNMSTLIYK